MLSFYTFFLVAALISNIVIIGFDDVYALISSASPISTTRIIKSPNQPVINDPNLKVETVFKGTKFPSTVAFLGPNDILLLQKDNGTVDRIVNGTISSKPLLRVNVATEAERGMLGIAVSRIKSNNNTRPTTYVFLYYTQSGGKTGDDITPGIQPLGNRLYRYELINDKLVNPKLLLNLPAKPGPFHNGGKIIIGPDNNVYVVIGDLFGNGTKIQNVKNGTDPDGRGGILRITQDGKPVKGILGDKYPLNLYYAYGIRNSFGMDFDPVTKKLWDTENGPNFGDEINLVEPGFNSGWAQVQGIWKPVGGFHPQDQGPVATHPERGLVDFGGKGKYRAPEFTWQQTVAPTALKFFNSTKLGKQYKNDLFVGDFNNGNLYHFELNQQRTGLLLNGPLSNKIVYSGKLLEMPANWTDPFKSCDHDFKCMVNSTTGWQNIKTSFQLSTNTTNKDTWSRIYGNEIAVKPHGRYELVTHMKLNRYATQSHVAIEGYNQTSRKWNQDDQITQCPSGTDGPMQWQGFSCNITIPKDTTKIRPILNAGWSSQLGKEAVTLFDAIYLNRIIASVGNNNLVSNPNFEQWITFGHGFGHITDVEIGLDGYLYVLSLQTDRPVYPGQIFPYTAPVKETIYRIVPARH